MKQLKFQFVKNYKKEFGGELLIGKRKTRRPLSTKKPIHIVIRSSQCKVFRPANNSLENLIRKHSARFGVKIYDLALNWSHIHAVIRIKDRSDYIKFIRALTSIMAQKIRSKLGEQASVFILRPFNRIIEWGRVFQNALNYTVPNHFEAIGVTKRNETKASLGSLQHKLVRGQK